MAKTKRAKTIRVGITPNTFSYLFKRFKGQKEEYEFSELSELRQVLSNEKAKILYTIKYEKPDSIYKLAKLLNRDFKSVSQDLKLLEKFGFIEFKRVQEGRKKVKPNLIIDSLSIIFEV